MTSSTSNADSLPLSPASAVISPPGAGSPPAFMVQDEILELSAVSIPEMMEITSDLSGMALGPTPGGVRVLSVAAEDEALARLDMSMSLLPPRKTAAYREALSHAGMVDRDFRLSFLEREDFDERRAAQRMAAYWSLKMDVFGPDKCFLPMTLCAGGSLRDDADVLKEYYPEMILPSRDRHGRAIIYSDLSRWDTSKISSKQVFRAGLYVANMLCQDPDLRRAGVVVIQNCKESGVVQCDMDTFYYTSRFMQAIPLRFRSVHICHPTAFMNCAFYPVLKFFSGRELRLRLRTHYGSDETVLSSLEAFGLPRDILPTSIGGSLDYDVKAWFADRILTENQGLPLSRRVRHQASSTTPSGTVQSSNTPARRRRGRGPRDPRMEKAVKAKLADPKMPLLDALVHGGYVFREQGSTTQGSMVDEDGITLRQRKNNLCRRIRATLKRRKDDESRSASEEVSVNAEA